MNRRDFVALLALGLAGSPRWGGAVELDRNHQLGEAWLAWKAAFLTLDGRVVDTFQDGASHSEGQGYGMTLATFFDDRDAFEIMFEWTETNLAVRPDALLSWRWREQAANPIADRNNASDGDLFYAWALTRAADRFDRPVLRERARATVQDMVERCVVPHPDGSGQLVLLPAVEGFRRGDEIIVNPSYLMPRALRELASALGVEAFDRCADYSQSLLGELSREGLAPDWIRLTPEGLREAEALSANNGYEAMRIALYHLWSGLEDNPAVLQQAAAYRMAKNEEAVRTAAGTPTVMDRRTFAVIERSPHAGYAAVAALLECAHSAEIGSTMPTFSVDQPYYPATLHLMALLSQAERFPRCLPI